MGKCESPPTLVGYGNHLHIQAKIYHRQKYLKDDVELQITLTGIEAKRNETKVKNKQNWANISKV